MALFSKKQTPRQPRRRPYGRAPAPTYYRSESKSEASSPFSKKTPKRRVSKYLIGVLDIMVAAAVILAVVYSLMIRPQPDIIAGNSTFHSRQQYQAAAAGQLKHFSNRNKITFDEQSLEKALQKQFPEIISVQTELPLFSERPTIRLKIASAKFFLNSRGSRYIIDSSGRAAALAGDLPQIKGLAVIDDKSGFQTSVGRQVLSANAVDFINTVAAESHQSQIQIASMVLPAVPEELDLRTNDQPYFVKFYLGGDPLAQTGQFLAARRHFADTHQAPAQYLDVRVPGKIFYK